MDKKLLLLVVVISIGGGARAMEHVAGGAGGGVGSISGSKSSRKLDTSSLPLSPNNNTVDDVSKKKRTGEPGEKPENPGWAGGKWGNAEGAPAKVKEKKKKKKTHKYKNRIVLRYDCNGKAIGDTGSGPGKKSSSTSSSSSEDEAKEEKRALKQGVDSITKLYRIFSYCCSGLFIYISDIRFDQTTFNLKKFFEENDIDVSQLTTSSSASWLRGFIRNAEALELNPKELRELGNPEFVCSHDLPRLVEDARSILKSFLLTEVKELPLIEERSVRKSGFNRLFTYAKLQQVIIKKKLTHVRLPKKVLVVYDRSTHEYLSYESALNIIDKVIKAQAFATTAMVHIVNISKNYDFIIFAQKEKNAGCFSQETMQELEELCEEAPFDVGYDNIFGDQCGDAVIIDTEFKGEPASSCIPKLKRYA